MRMNLSSMDSQRGFTLLEILVAFTILGIAITVIIQLFSANTRAIAASQGYSAAVSAAEAKMRAILDTRNLSEGQWDEQTEDGYSANVTVSEILTERTTGLPLKMQSIRLVLYWMNGSKQKTVVLRTARVVERPISQGGTSAQ